MGVCVVKHPASNFSVTWSDGSEVHSKFGV